MAEQYEAKANRTRVLAWSATGVAAAGVATFILGTVVSTNRYGSVGSEGTFEWHRDYLRRGEEVSPAGSAGCYHDVCDHRAEAGKLKAEIESWQAISYVGLAAAGAGAVAAGVLFVIGDPPGKYEAYRQKTGVVSMQIAPTPGGVLVQGQF
jgi:hypothetical protein